ncbi:MAG: AAA family ATPase [Okeania sp. SIO1H5]|nr:AAA family ATPase [Okeania sp. SIO1H5]
MEEWLPNVPTRKYSLGMRKKLGIAIALLGNPRFVLLDEPFNGLDPSGTIALKVLLRETAQRGVGILISSHLLDSLDRIYDDLIVLKSGKVWFLGNKEEVQERCGRGATLEDLYQTVIRP